MRVARALMFTILMSVLLFLFLPPSFWLLGLLMIGLGMVNASPEPARAAGPIKSKVHAAGIGAGAGALVGTILTWGFDSTIGTMVNMPTDVMAAFHGLLLLGIPIAGAYIGGYFKKENN